MSAEIPLTVVELGVTDQKVEAKEPIAPSVPDQSSEIQVTAQDLNPEIKAQSAPKQSKKEARQAAHLARMEEARAQKAARIALKRQRYEEHQKEMEEKRAQKKARKEASRKAHEEAQVKAAEVGSRSVHIKFDRKEMLAALQTSLAQHGEIVRARVGNMGFWVEFSQASTAKALLGTKMSITNEFAVLPVMIAANSLNFEVNGRIPPNQVEEAFEKIVGPDSISRITQPGDFVNVCFKTSEQRDTAMSITNAEEKVIVGGEHTIQSTAKGLRRNNRGKRKGGRR